MHKKDDLREMHDYEARRKANLEIADDTIQIVRQLREDVKNMMEKQQATEEKVHRLLLNAFISVLLESIKLFHYLTSYISRLKIWQPNSIGSSKP